MTPTSKVVADSELSVGSRLGPFELEEVLGGGAMGIVYRAVRASDGEVVALKVLRRELAEHDIYRRRLAHEARAAKDVEHKYLVPILEIGEAAGHHYLAVAYVRGRSLAERIEADGPLSLQEILRVASHVGAALDALHVNGFVHRDVKPSNIMLSDERGALLTDFGLAKGRTYSALTRPGDLLGTIDYLAPELIRGREAGPSSDIYAFACTIYECVVGDPPFAAKSPLQIGLAHLEEEPPDPSVGRADMSPDLAWAVMQGLAKDPSRRPTTATAYARMLSTAARAGQ